MAIDFGTALEVVQRCIRATGRTRKAITVDKKLEQVKITSQFAVDGMVHRIANSKSVGLPSLKPPHKINENLLIDVGTSTTVGEVVDIVGTSAEPE